jgi:hypothetical protein
VEVDREQCVPMNGARCQVRLRGYLRPHFGDGTVVALSTCTLNGIGILLVGFIRSTTDVHVCTPLRNDRT